MDRHFRKNLAIKLDIGFFQPMHELAVIHALCPNCGVDPGNPEPAEFAFAVFSVPIGIAQAMFHRFPGLAVSGTSYTAVAFG